MKSSYSFVQAGGKFPELRGKPSWRDSKTCVLTVWLRAATEYRLSINGPRHHGFASRTGVAAAPMLVVFRTGDAKTTLDPKTNRAAIAKVREFLTTRYSYRKLRKVTEDFALSEDALAQAGSPMTFARALASDLGVLRDVHVSVEVDGTKLPTHRPGAKPNVDVSTLKNHLTNARQINPRLAVADAAPGIGYLLVSSWSALQDVGLIRTAIRERPRKAWILDMRINGGGNEFFAQQIAAPFLDENVLYAKHEMKGKVFERRLNALPQTDRVAGPVAVLMGPACFSSTEGFLLMMKAASRATLIGARSGGSSGNPAAYELGNGVRLWLPQWRALRADGTCFEGEGIAPDIAVDAPQEALARGEDPILARAVKHLRSKLEEK